jgi:hypothetical protein
MRTQSSTALAAIFLALLAAPGYAQYGARPIGGPPIAPGEDYHVEVSAGYWNPTPDIVISSSTLGIQGTDISFVDDLGIEKKKFGDLRIVLKPGRKHKFRIAYTPLTWQASKVVTRDLVFNAQRYRVSLPVDSELQWKEWAFGYEYDFVSNAKGFAGLFLDLKYPRVNVTLSNPFVGTEFAEAKAPVPTIGGAGRVYVTPAVAINFELTALKIPQIENYKATFVDWDLAGIVNFGRNFGGRIGFRSMNVNYLFDQDYGDMDLKGLYFSAVARF